LYEKLPKIFSIYFNREGVINEMKKLSGDFEIKNNMMEEMKKITLIAMQNEEKSYLLDKEKFLENNIPENVQVEKEEKKPKFSLKNLFQKKKPSENSKVEREFKNFVKPKVKPPKIPQNSRLNEENLKFIEIKEYVVAIAQMFLIDNEFKNENDKMEIDLEEYSGISSSLKEISEVINSLDKFDEEKEIKIMKDFSKILIDEDGISSFEFINSDIIASLSHYFDSKNMYLEKRIKNFYQIFKEEIKVKSEKEFFVVSQSPLRNMSSFSKSLSSLSPSAKKENSFQTKLTYMMQFINMLQNCLNSVENIQVVNIDNQSFFHNFSIFIKNISKPIEILFQHENNEEINLFVSPLTKLKDLFELYTEKVKKLELLNQQQKEKILKKEKKKNIIENMLNILKKVIKTI
jgi:hypothetical protein